MSTRSTPHLPWPVLRVCGRINIRRGYKKSPTSTSATAVAGGADHAGDSVLFPRHDKRPRLDPFFMKNQSGNMKRGAVPDPPLLAENLQQSEHTKVYISFRVAPEATPANSLWIPHLARPSPLLQRGTSYSDATFRRGVYVTQRQPLWLRRPAPAPATSQTPRPYRHHGSFSLGR